MDLVTILGIVGAVIILVFFLLNQFKLMSVDSVWYDAGNLIGSVILFAYAWLIGSVPFLIINGVWALFSLRDVVIDITRR